jgi:hypothetical protein
MTRPPGSQLARGAALFAHIGLIGLLLAATTDRPPCSGDFIGACDLLLAPLLIGASLFVLIGTIRWGNKGRAGMLFVADFFALGFTLLNSSTTTGIALAAVGAGVSIVALALAEGTRREPLDPAR